MELENPWQREQLEPWTRGRFKKRKGRFRTLVEQAADAFLLNDPQGRTINTPQEVPLEKLSREAVEIVDGQAKKEGVCIEEIGSDLPVLFGDRVRLVEVQQDLIDNAIKYVGDQPIPRVEIGISRLIASIRCSAMRVSCVALDVSFPSGNPQSFDKLFPTRVFSREISPRRRETAFSTP